MTTTPTPTSTNDQERTLLAAARTGDEAAYGRLVETYRGELHAHCYRMLGSVPDAEDALQDALLRAWRGLPRFEGRSSLRNWLFKIATNACLNAIERRPPRLLPMGFRPASDPWDTGEAPLAELAWMGPYPDDELGVGDGKAGPAARYDQRESLEIAFIAALQLLPAQQRATLIMREVLGYSAREVAESLDTSVAAVNSSLQRARKAIAAQTPEQSQGQTLRALGEEGVRDAVRRYMDAMERADVDAVIAMLTEDATWSMPPYASWFRGHADITVFLRENALKEQSWRHAATHANGQAAVACYLLSEDGTHYEPHVIDVLTFEGTRIAAVTAFVDSDVFPRFNLPASLPLM